MITKEEIFALLIAACPSFENAWNDLDDEEKELHFVCLGFFARHLLDLYALDQTSEFQAVVEVIERLHLEGDNYVQEAATIGFLEGVQNVWGNNNVDPEHFGKLLLPESRLWWCQLLDFWSGKIPYVGASISKSQ